MPLENNLRVIMAEQRIDNLSELIKITGLSRNSLNKLWHNENVESIKLETLMIICDSLNVSLNELIKYVPNAE
ncbi:helix-turn-helix domain-containing protein [Oceanobacillus caeni]